MQSINGETSLYGIIGDPVQHSLSPLFQNEFLKKTQQNAAYLPFHVSPDSLKHALAGLYSSGVQGLNITVPHKETALDFVHADKVSTMIGAINTIKKTNTGWSATNTDWQGFVAVLQGLQADTTKPALVFGAGGTSRAVIHALHYQGAKEVWICNRSRPRAEQLSLTLQRNYSDLDIHLLDWDKASVLSQSQKSSILINTTSIGLHPQDEFPFLFHGEGIAIDAVYKPNEATAFCKIAKESGAYLTADGLPMLIAQGIASFAFWHKSSLEKGDFNLPDKLESLQWVEETLKRQPLRLPGWEK